MKYKKIFFVGINGISMSALAKLSIKMGIDVLGSDKNCGELAKNLQRMGVKIYKVHRKSNIKGCDLVVYSSAIGKENKELVEAKRLNIKTMERAEYLGWIASKYKNVIAIAGTHGKTTTTAMIGYIFLLAGLNPTVHIGGEFKYFGGNLFCGGTDFFVTEACEFKDSFLKLKPNVSVVTNIEREHLDYFKTFEKEVLSFNKFLAKTKEMCFVNEKYNDLLRDNLQVTFCGTSNKSDWQARKIEMLTDGRYCFEVFFKNKSFGKINLGVAGDFNVKNALLAIAVARKYGIDMKIIKTALESFCNVNRRFEKLGEKYENDVVIDYAHHPTEIAKTIKMCKEVYNKRLVCIFQPHTFSRTESLINDFLTCFDGVDELVLLSTYSAREEYVYLGSVEFLKDKLVFQKPNYKIAGAFDKKELENQLEKYKNCTLLFLGAGDIDKCARRFVEKK